MNALGNGGQRNVVRVCATGRERERNRDRSSGIWSSEKWCEINSLHDNHSVPLFLWMFSCRLWKPLRLAFVFTFGCTLWCQEFTIVRARSRISYVWLHYVLCVQCNAHCVHGGRETCACASILLLNQFNTMNHALHTACSAILIHKHTPIRTIRSGRTGESKRERVRHTVMSECTFWRKTISNEINYNH